VFLQDAHHVMPMIPDCECVATMAPPRRSTSSARFCGVRCSRREILRVQVGHVEPAASPRVRHAAACSTRRPRRGGNFGATCGRPSVGFSGSRGSPCGTSVPFVIVRAGREQDARTTRPGAVVGDASEIRNQSAAALTSPASIFASASARRTDRSRASPRRTDRRRRSRHLCGRNRDTSLRGRQG
jgi:hypothetical protein